MLTGFALEIVRWIDCAVLLRPESVIRFTQSRERRCLYSSRRRSYRGVATGGDFERKA
jgi:hypothetical protein